MAPKNFLFSFQTVQTRHFGDVLSLVCWMKSRGVVPNTKILNSESKFSVINSEETTEYIKESNS